MNRSRTDTDLVSQRWYVCIADVMDVCTQRSEWWHGRLSLPPPRKPVMFPCSRQDVGPCPPSSLGCTVPPHTSYGSSPHTRSPPSSHLSSGSLRAERRFSVWSSPPSAVSSHSSLLHLHVTRYQSLGHTQYALCIYLCAPPHTGSTEILGTERNFTPECEASLGMCTHTDVVWQCFDSDHSYYSTRL